MPPSFRNGRAGGRNRTRVPSIKSRVQSHRLLHRQVRKVSDSDRQHDSHRASAFEAGGLTDTQTFQVFLRRGGAHHLRETATLLLLSSPVASRPRRMGPRSRQSVDIPGRPGRTSPADTDPRNSGEPPFHLVTRRTGTNMAVITVEVLSYPLAHCDTCGREMHTNDPPPCGCRPKSSSDGLVFVVRTEAPARPWEGTRESRFSEDWPWDRSILPTYMKRPPPT